MSSSPRRTAARLLAAGAVCAGVLLPATGASADEPAGTTVVGELVQAYPEQAEPDHDGAADAPLSWIRTAAGESVRVDTADLPDVPAGSTVSVDVGGEVDDAATAAGYDPAQAVVATDVLGAPAAAALPASAVTDEITVVQVTPPGVPGDGVELQRLVDTVNGPVAGFWSQQTGGAVHLHVTDARGWVELPVDCTDPNGLWSRAAATAGFQPGPGRHLVVYLNPAADLPGCSYALGTVGAGPASGGSLYVRDTLPSVIAHELGHNFGLGHSSGLQCDAGVEGGTCRTEGYRDYYDVMGASWEQTGALTAAQADRLGLLGPGARAAVAAGGPAGTYDLAPLAGSSGTRAVELTAADGAVYWLEYRRATGQDAWLGTAANRFGLQAGVLLHRAGSLPDTSLLLDGTPSGRGADLHAALPVGTPVPVDGGAFTVTVQAVGAGSATVSVTAAPVVPGAVVPAPAPEATGGVLAGRAAGQAEPGGTGPAATTATTTAVATAAAPAAPEPAAAAAATEPAVEAAQALDPAASTRTTTNAPVGLCAIAGGAVLLTGAAASRLRRRLARR